MRSRTGRAAVGVAAFAAAAVITACAAHADAVDDVLAASQVPLDNAQQAITEALPGLDSAATSFLTEQNMFLADQDKYLTSLATLQDQLPSADTIQLADLDKLLITADDSLLYHTTAFISAVETAGPIAQFFAGADLVQTDFSAISTDIEAVLGTALIEWFPNLDLSGLLAL